MQVAALYINTAMVHLGLHHTKPALDIGAKKVPTPLLDYY